MARIFRTRINVDGVFILLYWLGSNSNASPQPWICDQRRLSGTKRESAGQVGFEGIDLLPNQNPKPKAWRLRTGEVFGCKCGWRTIAFHPLARPHLLL